MKFPEPCQKSTTLIPAAWDELIEGTDKVGSPSDSIISGRTLMTLGLFAPGPILFFRKGFSSKP